MTDPASYLDIIDLLYGAALDPELWPDALGMFSQVAGGLGTVILSLDNPDASTIASASLADAARSYEADGWWRHDILRERGQKLLFSSGLFTDRDVVSRETKSRHPLFQEFWREHGLGSMACFAVRMAEDQAVTIAVQRPIDRGDFETPELDAIRRLGPHAARALLLAGHVAKGTSSAASMDQLVARLNIPAIIIDRKYRVRAHNDHAQRLIGREIDITFGLLKGRTGAAQKALDRAISAAFAADASEPTTEAIPSSTRATPILVQAIRLTGRRESSILSLFAEERALITFIVPGASASQAPSKALLMMGLTAAEARIALAVGRGQSPAEAAAAFDVSVGTVRVQLKSIFSKLGLHRQSDLVRLVSQLSVVS